jgi:hypothetical protein
MTQPFPPAKFLTMHQTSNFHGYEFLYTVRNGERGRNRTCDPRLKRALLYQLSYAPSPLFTTSYITRSVRLGGNLGAISLLAERIAASSASTIALTVAGTS